MRQTPALIVAALLATTAPVGAWTPIPNEPIPGQPPATTPPVASEPLTPPAPREPVASKPAPPVGTARIDTKSKPTSVATKKPTPLKPSKRAAETASPGPHDGVTVDFSALAAPASTSPAASAPPSRAADLPATTERTSPATVSAGASVVAPPCNAPCVPPVVPLSPLASPAASPQPAPAAPVPTPAPAPIPVANKAAILPSPAASPAKAPAEELQPPKLPVAATLPPIATPAADVPTRPTPLAPASDGPTEWQVNAGEYLQEVLERWTRDAGWTLAWKTTEIYDAEASATFRGDIYKVVTQLLSSWPTHSHPPRADFYRGNRVLVITSRHAATIR